MIYQIDGKIVPNKPKGKFKKIVVIPGKLMNFITKETSTLYNLNLDYWLKKLDGTFHHIAKIRSELGIVVYVDGKLV